MMCQTKIDGLILAISNIYINQKIYSAQEFKIGIVDWICEISFESNLHIKRIYNGDE